MLGPVAERAVTAPAVRVVRVTMIALTATYVLERASTAVREHDGSAKASSVRADLPTLWLP